MNYTSRTCVTGICWFHVDRFDTIFGLEWEIQSWSRGGKDGFCSLRDYDTGHQPRWNQVLTKRGPGLTGVPFSPSFVVCLFDDEALFADFLHPVELSTVVIIHDLGIGTGQTLI